MKSLLLVLLVGVTAIPVLADPGVAAPVPTEVSPAVCSANLESAVGTTAQIAPALSSPAIGEPAPVQAADRCVYRVIHYYTSLGGAHCGTRYMYCTPPNVHDGCLTPYWQVVAAGCSCA